MGETFILTGICGHLGNCIANELMVQGKTLRGLALPGENAAMLDKSIMLVRGDVRDISSMQPLFDGIAEGEDVYFIHAAGLISIEGRKDGALRAVNVGGTRNVIELCKMQRVKKLVYVSSVHAIAEKPAGQTMEEQSEFTPSSVAGLYSKSKAEATQLVMDAVKQGLSATVVHPSGLIGPNDYGRGLMTQLVADYLNGTVSACVKGGYDFADVRDVACGVLSAAYSGGNGECYILSNRYYAALDILNMLHELTGKRRVRTVLPLWFVKACTPLCALYFKLKKEKPLFTKDSLSILNANAAFSHEKARRELGYFPRDIRQTLKDTVLFLQSIGRLNRSYTIG